MNAFTRSLGLSSLALSMLLFTACQSTPSASQSSVGKFIEYSPAETHANLEKAITLLQNQFDTGDAPQRANCIEALQILNDHRTVQMIEAGLQDKESVVRFAAAMALGKQKVPTLKPMLQQLFLSETDANVKVALVYALHQLQDDSNMGYLAHSLSSPEYSVRANTALILGLLKNKTAIEALLLPARKDPEAHVRFEITAAMARLGDPQAKEDLIALSVNRSVEAYLFALAVYPDIDHPDVNNVLDRGILLPNEYSNLRSRDRLNVDRGALLAARGLGKRHDPRALNAGKLIINYSKDTKNPELRTLAALALGEILLPFEEAPLMRLIEDPDVNVRIAAAAAIVNVSVRDTQK